MGDTPTSADTFRIMKRRALLVALVLSALLLVSLPSFIRLTTSDTDIANSFDACASLVSPSEVTGPLAGQSDEHDTPGWSQASTCIRNKTKLLLLSDPLRIERVLNAVATRSPQLAPVVCHAASHGLGETLAAERRYEPIRYFCLGGVLHGYFSERGRLAPDVLSYMADVKGFCENFDQDMPAVVRFDCSHGIGHGLGLVRGVTLRSAFDDCRTLFGDLGPIPGTSLEQKHTRTFDCATGVVSSAITALATEGTITDLDRSDILGSCATMGEFAALCLSRAADLLAALGTDVETLLPGCSTSSSPQWCSWSLGFRAGRAYVNVPAAARFAVCESLGTLGPSCTAGLLRSLIPAAVLQSDDTSPCTAAPDPDGCVREERLIRAFELSPRQTAAFLRR